ncbi:MAG: NCS1 family nucleobase:cation symporter-1 [Candidatus Dormiibacterota bacterium]
MGVSTEVPVQVTAPDGRVSLQRLQPIERSPLYNQDLAPIPMERRHWTTYNYAALWIGMSHNIPSYLLASGLIALGMSWLQALITIAIANCIVLLPMLLNSHAGTKYGIPFPVFARASFGTMGANLAALLRAIVACGWFGIQTWIGGEGIFTLVGVIAGKSWTGAAHIGGYPWTQWLSFFVFWAIGAVLIVRGMEMIRRFENWAAPFVLAVAVILLVYIAIKANGFGPLLSEPSKLGWGPAFWSVFFPSLMGMIAFWSTMSLNMPDFTRFGGSQRAQILGQILGLPTTMTFFSLLAVLITSGGIVLFHATIWDPIQLSSHFTQPVAIAIALFTVVVATLATNLAANTVSPSYDFSNAFPRLISFRVGGVLTMVIGVLIQPWRLLASAQIYIYTWLGFYGGFLGTVAGVLVADYWLLRGTRLSLADLYLPHGRYRYAGGWNWRGVVALVVGAVLAAGGAYSAPGSGPFPSSGLIPFLKPLYDYNWVVGFVAALVVYYGLSKVFGRSIPDPGAQQRSPEEALEGAR